MWLLFYLTHFKPLEQKSRKQNLEYLWTLQFSSEISWPLKRVYWVDTYLDYIEAVDYDGGNRKTILRGSPVQNLYSASVFENSLYLTSWRNNSILRVNKFRPGEDHSTILDGLERPFAIQVFHSQRQPISHLDSDGQGHPCEATTPCKHVRKV